MPTAAYLVRINALGFVVMGVNTVDMCTRTLNNVHDVNNVQVFELRYSLNNNVYHNYSYVEIYKN